MKRFWRVRARVLAGAILISLPLVATAATSSFTSLTTSPNPSKGPSPVALTATVKVVGANPTGAVQFFDGTTAFSGSVALGVSSSGFLDQTTYALGGRARLVKIADLNGDGKDDLIIATLADPTHAAAIRILTGNGDGTFQPPASYVLSNPSGCTASNPTSIAVGDFDGDGKLDIAVTDAGDGTCTGVLWIGLNAGGGILKPFVAVTVGISPAAAVTGDFDKNGKVDLAVANFGNSTATSTLTLLLGKGDGTFTASTVTATDLNSPIGLVRADFNADGNPDLAVLNFGDGKNASNVVILGGKGDGTFTVATTVAVGAAPSAIEVADLNGDNRPDLITANSGSNNITVLLATGSNTFSSPTTLNLVSDWAASTATRMGDLVFPSVGNAGNYRFQALGDGTTGTSAPAWSQAQALGDLVADGTLTWQNIGNPVAPQHIAIADLNRDGHLDIAEVSGSANTVGIFRGNGDGTFQATPTFLLAGPNSVQVAVGNFTGGGIHDLAVANLGGLVSDWAASRTIKLGDVVLPSLGNLGQYRFQAVAAGTTGTSAPIWSQTVGDSVTDGTVTWKNIGNPPSTTPVNVSTGVLLSAGVAEASQTLPDNLNSALTAGTHVLTAQFSSSNNSIASSTSNAVTQTVNAVPTILSLASDINPSKVGTPVTLTAAVNHTDLSVIGSESGTINFLEVDTINGGGTKILGTASIVNRQAQLVVSTFTAGTHQIFATYPGDAYFSGSSSATVQESVTANAPTFTTLTSTANPANVGVLITLTAAVSPATGSATPTGSVTFLDGSAPLTNGQGIVLNQGVATLAISTLSPGTHNLTAVYSGDSNFSPSTSAPLAQAIQQSNSLLTLSSTLNPAPPGTVVFTATVAGVTGATVPTGTVKFVKDGDNSHAVNMQLNNSIATFPVQYSASDVGTHVITAVYLGDSTYTISNVGLVVQTISTDVPVVSGLAFGAVPVGKVSSPQFIAVLNPTANPVSGIVITTAAPYSQQNNCADTLAPNGMCVVTVTFTPTVLGPTPGELDISPASLTPSVVPLSGSGVNSILSAKSPTFPDTAVGEFSLSVSVDILNTSNGGITLGALSSTGDFQVIPGSCAPLVVLSGNTSCNVWVSFVPTASGTRQGSLVLNYVGPNSPLILPLSGNAFVPATGKATTTSLTAPATAMAGSPVTWIATVHTSAGIPSGTISFVEQGTLLQAVQLDATGSAKMTLASLPVGSHTITASYLGDFESSTSAPLIITITAPPGVPTPTPSIASLSPVSAKQNSGAFTLTVDGAGFITGAVVTWNGSARPTTIVNDKQVTASIAAADLTSAGTAMVAVTNGGTSSGIVLFAIDTSTSTSVTPTSPTLALAAGQSGAVKVQVSGFVGTITGTCLNAPAGVSCSYDQAGSAINIQTAATTPKGTYELTAMLSAEVLARNSDPAGIFAVWLGFPGFLIGGVLAVTDRRGRKLRAPHILASLLLVAVVLMIACGGGGGSSSSTGGTPATHAAQASTALTLTVQ